MKPFGRASIVAGIIAGAIYMLLQMSLPHIFEGKGVFTLPENIAAILYGPGILNQGFFGTGPVIAFLILHFLVSILFAMVVGLFIKGAPILIKIAGGISAGALLYYGSFYIATYIFTWFANFRGWTCLLDHAIFGIITALIYDWMYARTMKKEQIKTSVQDGAIHENSRKER